MRNRYKVPKRQWARWTDNARNVFNTLYGVMIADPGNYQHPKATPVPRAHWRTTAWNAAFIAACSVAE